ncbi:RNA-binding protein, putative [Trypanosoma brucei gambiense DAL972]|uniref:RNA-binding protein, putative n=1 Tax=Trypanosoma brucei gambiense (strain MHOM/CI/86/DAL972) TaxID=679716 RepID=D0A5H9_TRYB9|nr:RNA-binding protein, putative [Trypanosoma brucei gambiense DAL972]CBH16930.1 RNA-binding protein, putative [Trypanosoma brucei gambiense DAL972]|eukprot:XP_011779194.1 RNA-binding protein, putative [Trypanosoma brucei gambiense DAL972]
MSQVPLASPCDPYNTTGQSQSELQQQQQQPAQQQQQQQQQQQAPPPQPLGQVNQEPDFLRNLMVNYIPTTVDEVQLRQLFERFGAIESVKIVCDRETRQSRGYGFVKFQSASSAQQAIASLNGFVILNKRLKVALAASGHQRGRNMNNGFNAYGGYGGYGGYGAYPPVANPYAQQQMMAMYQQYMMHAPPQQTQLPPPPPPQQSPGQTGQQSGRPARK